jgi:hypothetical protein
MILKQSGEMFHFVHTVPASFREHDGSFIPCEDGISSVLVILSVAKDLVCRGEYLAKPLILKQSCKMLYTVPASFREHDCGYRILIRSAYPVP